MTTFGALARSGFRRYATYRQATVAGSFTNIVFGFLRCYVLLAVAAAATDGNAAGYDATQLATYVWVGQGLLSVVALWGWNELADRIRTGDVAADLLRPVPPVTSYLAADLGRAGHGMLTRFVPPLVAGAIFFPLYAPARWFTVPLFAMSVLAGLYFPLRLLPDALAVTLWVATPFPSVLQTPLDVLVERDPAALQTGLVALQAAWAAGLLALCALVQRRAERKLVVQGG